MVRMKRHTTVILAACGLALAGCSEPETPAPVTETATATVTATPEPSFAPADLGDTIDIPAASLRIDALDVAGECLHGETAPAEGTKLVQIHATLKAARPDLVVEPPLVSDSPTAPATTCTPPDGAVAWETPAPEGGHRLYGAFLVPESATHLVIGGRSFDLAGRPAGVAAPEPAPAEPPAAETAAPEAPSSDNPVPPPPAPGEAPEPVFPDGESVVGYVGAPGSSPIGLLDKTIASCGTPGVHESGTTFFTDGTSGWTQNCALQMM